MTATGSSLLRGLVVACHPLPTLAVTTFAAGWGAATGLPLGRVALVFVAVLLGQLAIGWCNDAVDAPRDVAADRRDKPVVAGLVTAPVLVRATVVAVVLCVPASFALGVRAGLVHMGVLASGLVYDLALKPTAWSPLPYAVAFGLLPAVAHPGRDAARVARPRGRWPGARCSAWRHTSRTPSGTPTRTRRPACGGCRNGSARRARCGRARCSWRSRASPCSRPPRTRAPWRSSSSRRGILLAVAGAVLGARMAERGRTAFRLTLAAVALVIVGFLLSA